MLLYVEFISRRPHVSLEDFHRGAARAQSSWAGAYNADRIVLDVGRSWRVGPEPEYLCVWFSPDHGLDRIDDWEDLFNAGEHDAIHAEFDAVARIDRAGCYRPLIDPVLVDASHYYVEWLEISAVLPDAEVVSTIENRTRELSAARELSLLARPVGPLAPNSRGFAAWALQSWSDAEALADSAAADGPVRTVDASLYAAFGKEQL